MALSLESCSRHLIYKNKASLPLPSSSCFKLSYVCTVKSQMYLIQPSKEKKSSPLMVFCSFPLIWSVTYKDISSWGALKCCKCFSCHRLCSGEIQGTCREKACQVKYELCLHQSTLLLVVSADQNVFFFSCNQQIILAPFLNGFMLPDCLNLKLFHYHVYSVCLLGVTPVLVGSSRLSKV